jgi:hypothetical protein
MSGGRYPSEKSPRTRAALEVRTHDCNIVGVRRLA